MRQKYLLMFTLFLAFTFTNYAQTPIITHVVDGTCGSDAKFVELYISGSVDLSEYKLVRRSNDGTWADDGADIDLSAFGTKTDEFIYVIRDLATLNTEFPSAGIDVDNSIVSGSVSHNGDDSYRIVEIAGDVVIDQFGADTDGTGEPWEYVDSWGNRNNEAGPNPTFDISEWTFNALDALDDTGICNSDPDAVPPVVYPPLEDTVTTLGSYQVASAGENGEICSTAFVVDQIPFNDSGDTANTGDNYSETDRPVIDNAQVATGSGSGLYLNGNDTVYEFTPATDGTFTFELSNHVTWVGFWLFEGCEPFTNTVAYHLGSSSTGRTFSDLSLTGGETYYVVISTYPTPQTTTYTLDITQITCPAPSDLVNDLVTTTSADFSWTAGASETGGYEYVVMPEGLNPIDDFADNVDNGTTAAGVTTVSSTGLSPNTAYDFYVLALCDAGDTSDYVSVSFETPCSAFTPDYSEDFASYVPDCWEVAGAGDPTTGPSDFGSSLWSHDQFLNATGTNNSVNINLYTNSREDWLISPTFDLSAGGYELVYIAAVTDYQNSDVPEGNGMGSDDEVQVLITEDDGLTWTALRTYNQSDFPSETGDLETIDLSAYTGNVRFAFWGTDGAVDDPEDYDFFIDEFEVRTPPNCFEPTGLNVTNITVNSADLNWDDDVAALNGYNWSVYASPSDPEVDTAVDSGTAAAGETMVQVTGLTPDTDYDFYLSSDCDTNGVSSLAGPESFFTGYCAPVHTNTFDYVVSLETIGAEQNVSITQTVQGPNQGYQDLTDQTIEAFIDSSFDVDVTYSFGTFGFKAWVDWNNDLVFAEDEVIFTDENTTASAISTFVVPDDVLAGDYRVRFRAYWPNDEDPGSCESITWGDAFDYTLTVSEAAPAFANVQVIHNSPDPAAASVDVYLDGALLDDLTGVNFREATGFLLAPADVDIVIDVVPAGGDISTSVFTQTLNLVEDENYIIVANGVLDPTAFITDNAFELSIYAGARTVAADPADVDVLVHHGSPDAPAVDVNEVTAGNLVANIAYPEFQGYLSLPEADYTLEIAAAGTPDALLTYSAPLATLGGFEGTAITVIASGFLGDDAGTDNGFGLWVATAAGGPLLELPLVEDDGPMDPAPDPIEDPENVISLFSGVYTNVTVDTWLTPWSSADLEDIQIQGNDTKLYTNLDFAGIETVANPIDATEMDFFHIDVWSPNATTFRVKLVDLGSGAVEGEIAFDIAQEEWVSLQIPLDDFADADVVTDPNNLLTVRNSIQQLIISGLPVGAVTAYVDNVYFSDDPSVSTIDFDADNFTYYPNPVNSELRIEANNTIEQVEVFNVLGQRVISQRPNQTNPILDMNNLEAGVYLMKVSIDGTNKTFQIIKD
jgi:chitodextrinase